MERIVSLDWIKVSLISIWKYDCGVLAVFGICSSWQQYEWQIVLFAAKWKELQFCVIQALHIQLLQNLLMISLNGNMNTSPNHQTTLLTGDRLVCYITSRLLLLCLFYSSISLLNKSISYYLLNISVIIMCFIFKLFSTKKRAWHCTVNSGPSDTMPSELPEDDPSLYQCVLFSYLLLRGRLI